MPHRDEVQLQDRWASGRHARIERRGEVAVIVDLGSRNGTWVNGVRVGEQRLNDGDLIEVGRTLLCYRDVESRLADALVAGETAPRLGPTATHNPEVAALICSLKNIAPTREPVLVLGETGTGKEVVAGALHGWSGRSGELRALDCGAVPDSLFESTFFGHVRGAFTGAYQTRVGEMVLARDGTLFLDEVANMSLAGQAKLLRVLEDGSVNPVGAPFPERVDIRLVAATNRNLLEETEGFRPDLLRRIAGFVAHLVPLRQRREDLGELSAHFLADTGATSVAIQPRAARLLFLCPFAGNIRQLRTVLRSAVALSAGQPIALEHLPPLSTLSAQHSGPPRDGHGEPPAGAGAQPATHRVAPDLATIDRALQQTQGNMVRAAQLLRVHPRQLYRWVEKHSIDVARYRG